MIDYNTIETMMKALAILIYLLSIKGIVKHLCPLGSGLLKFSPRIVNTLPALPDCITGKVSIGDQLLGSSFQPFNH